MDYDAVPYECRPVAASAPDRLRVVARLAGVEAADVRTARVLEFGCGDGANLLPLAARFPEASFVGVELSAVQAQEGRDKIAALGLTNFDLQTGDLTEFVAAPASFDYVLCHGVFSWVPNPVRRAIFSQCRRLLAPAGVAYISFNAQPGWSVRGRLREALLRHASGSESPRERIDRARAMIQILRDSTLQSEDAYAQLFSNELDLLERVSDSYLLHEFLAADNRAFAMSEFLTLAGEAELGFVGESLAATGFVSVDRHVERTVRERVRDSEAALDVIDLVTYRQFRGTVLGHREVVDGRSRGGLAGLLDVAHLVAEVECPDLDHGPPWRFVTGGGDSVDAPTPCLRCALETLGREFPRGLDLSALCATVAAKLGESAPPLEDVDAELRAVLPAWCDEGHVELRLYEPWVEFEIPEFPLAEAVTRLEALEGEVVTTPWHEPLDLDDLTRTVLGFCDGSRDPVGIVRAMIDWHDDGGLELRIQGKSAAEPSEVRATLTAVVHQSLGHLARRGLLRPAGP